MIPRRASRQNGITLVEVIIFSTISCVALLGVAQFLKKNFQMQNIMTSAEVPPEATHAMDLLIGDLKESIPGSTQWDVLTSTMPLSFGKTRLNPDTGKYEPYALAYGYQGPEKGVGVFVRVENSSTTVLLPSIDAPTETAPLFQYDPALHIIMIDIRYHAPGKPPLRLVRRLALWQ